MTATLEYKCDPSALATRHRVLILTNTWHVVCATPFVPAARIKSQRSHTHAPDALKRPDGKAAAVECAQHQQQHRSSGIANPSASYACRTRHICACCCRGELCATYSRNRAGLSTAVQSRVVQRRCVRCRVQARAGAMCCTLLCAAAAADRR